MNSGASERPNTSLSEETMESDVSATTVTRATDDGSPSSETANASVPVLRLEHVRKSFADNEVLHDITCVFGEGEVVGVIGPSGSGKSTLLRCATLLETMDSGLLAYDDEVLVRNDSSGHAVYESKSKLRKARSKFGLVFQDFNLFPHYTVLKNLIDAPIHVQKRDRDEVVEEARELLGKMGLSDKEDAVPCELSGGQQQRVSIARALAMNPHILFFDEPTSALDPELTGEILHVIRELADEHMTMVIVTHEMNFARDVADRILFMDGGYVVEEGPADQVVNNPQHERLKNFLNKLED